MTKTELFCIPSRHAIRITKDDGTFEYRFYPNHVRARLDYCSLTGEEPEIITNLSDMFPRKQVKVVRK